MIRDGAQEAQAVNYYAGMRGLLDLISPQWRDSVGAASASFDARINVDGTYVAPENSTIWLAITRVAEVNQVYIEWSRDGQNWNLGHSRTQMMGDTVAYGFAITNHEPNDFLAEATVSNVELTPFDKMFALRSFSRKDIAENVTVDVSLELINPAASTLTETVPDGWVISNISDGGTASGSTITWNITSQTSVSYSAQMPVGSESATFSGSSSVGLDTMGEFSLAILAPGVGIFDFQADINVSAAGSAELVDGSYFVTGSGADIWGGADGFHYLYSPVSGPLRIEATVFNFVDDGDATWAKTGLMVRQDTTPGAVNGFIGVRSDAFAFRQVRPSAGADSSSASDNPDTAAQNGRVAIERIGNSFMYYYQNWDDEWVPWGTMNATDLSDPVLVGLAVTSHSNGNLTSAEYVDVVLQVYDGFASRYLPSKVLPVEGGTISGVEVTAVITEGKTSNGTVKEVLPAGFSATNIQTTNGSATLSGTTINWKLSGATGEQTMTYDLTIPAQTGKSLVTISGDLGGLTTGGDSGLFPVFFTAPYTPNASVTMDGLISAGEYDGGYSETFDNEDSIAPGTFIDGSAQYAREDNNVTFHIVHNNQYIWVGFDVVDKDLAFNENETEAWNNDSLEFYIDGNISRLSTKEGNQYGFQATVVGNGRLVGGEGAPAAIQGNGYVYSDAGAYWNFATRVKSSNDGWVTEYQVDKEQVLDPPTNTIIGFDCKVNGSQPGAGTRTSNWGYWFTDFDGLYQDAFWNNETGWAIVDIQQGFVEAGVSDWALF
jgi:hypothetical protein